MKNACRIFAVSAAVVMITILALIAPSALQAREEKPVSMEAIMEELANLRILVEAQQRQIEALRAAVHVKGGAAPEPERQVQGQAQAPAHSR